MGSGTSALKYQQVQDQWDTLPENLKLDYENQFQQLKYQGFI
jgi:hypothetical protein